MLFWAGVAVFGFSIGLTWHNSVKRKKERERRLKEIRSKIEANENAKKLKTED